MFQPAPRRRSEQGNVLFIILIAIVLLGLMTQFVSKSSQTQTDISGQQVSNNEVGLMLTQAVTLEGAVHQMIINGEDPSTLYTNLSILKPGDGGYETAPHTYKVYHPLGGGIGYMAATSEGSSAVATTFSINKGSIVTGVGATDAAIGDILFTAKVTTVEACRVINKKMTGSTDIPVLSTAVFNNLFTNGVTVTLAAGNCADCVNKPRVCVSNSDASAFGYYAALLPG